MLVDSDKYYIVDLFSNKFSVFLPAFGTTMKRKAYPISKEDIPESLVMRDYKTNISTSKAIGITSAVYIFQRIISKYIEIDISVEMTTLIEIVVLLIISIGFIWFMVLQKKRLTKTLSVDMSSFVVIRRKFVEDKEMKLLLILISVDILLLGGCYLLLYFNSLSPGIILFIAIIGVYSLILQLSIQIGTTQNCIYLIDNYFQSNEF